MVGRVTIDGIDYTPADNTPPNLGIAITTKDRYETFKNCHTKLLQHTPPNTPIIIIDDGSTTPVPEATHRNNTSKGIPTAKNQCLEALLDLGVEHLILLDNDCAPTTNNWWQPFTNHPEPHLSAQFLDLNGDRKLSDITILYEDDTTQAWSGQRGYCLYYHKTAIEKVGGFDTIYTPGLYEHSDLANRIYEAGLTTWRYASPRDSHKLIESLDQNQAVGRTPLPDRQQLTARNANIHNTRRDQHYKGHAPYRPTRNTILTCLYTSQKDPQRGTQLTPDTKALQPLINSAKPNKIVILHDQLDNTPSTNQVTYTKAPNTVNVYFQRWINAYNWLRNNDIDNILICDGTDVEILQPTTLFDNIPDNHILVGSEHQIVGCDWMRKNHPDTVIQQFLTDYHHHQLLNAGVLLGSRRIVLDVLRDIIHAWSDIEMRQFHKKSDGNGVGDMAVFNMVLYTKYRDRLVYGPGVTSLFKGDERNSFSLIKHK